MQSNTESAVRHSTLITKILCFKPNYITFPIFFRKIYFVLDALSGNNGNIFGIVKKWLILNFLSHFYRNIFKVLPNQSVLNHIMSLAFFNHLYIWTTFDGFSNIAFFEEKDIFLCLFQFIFSAKVRKVLQW